MPHTVRLMNSQLVTGQSWCKDNPLFFNLPLTMFLVCSDDSMVQALEALLGGENVDGQVKAALMVCNKTLSYLSHLILPFAVYC